MFQLLYMVVLFAGDALLLNNVKLNNLRLCLRILAISGFAFSLSVDVTKFAINQWWK